MSYKYSKGAQVIGDLKAEDDAERNTLIDFEEDYIALVTSGSSVLVVSGSQVGVGTTAPTEILTLNAPSQDAPTISFKADDAEIATIGMNSSENIVIENKASNRPIVFKVSDGGVSREGFRISPNGIGSNPEVVINEGSDSLVDFRVEADNNPYMIFVDGANDSVAIGTDTPNSGFHVNTSVTFAGNAISQNYTATAVDHMIFVDAGQNNVTLSLPTAVGIAGRQYIVKRVDYSGQYQVTVGASGSETIEGSAALDIANQNSVVIVSDNSNWWIISEFITPPP